MMMTDKSRTPANPALEKSQIDRGERGDKAAGFDPGAAPMGTDEEAAGNHAIPDGLAAVGRVSRPPPGQTTDAEHSIAPDAGKPKKDI